MFQLYRGSQFYCRKKPDNPKETTNLPTFNDKSSHIKLIWAQFDMPESNSQLYW